jgi:hypothetical protein
MEAKSDKLEGSKQKRKVQFKELRIRVRRKEKGEKGSIS